jgi:hypothetical protein
MTTEAPAKAQVASLDAPTETRPFDNGVAQILEIGGGVIGRLILHPGWRWSKDVKPIAQTEWCEAPHFQYSVSGTLHVQMVDGEEFDLIPGTVSYLPAGHDAWVVGDEPAVVVDWHGATHYAER